jgi:hypothetical protein
VVVLSHLEVRVKIFYPNCSLFPSVIYRWWYPEWRGRYPTCRQLMCLCSPPCSRPAALMPHTILFRTKTTWRLRVRTGQKAARQPRSSPTILKRRAGELDFFCRAEHLLPLILIFMSYLACQKSVLRIRDPVPFWPRDPGSGMGKKSGSGMNNPNHISESLETFF